jgi:hypothetical protein
MQNPFFKFLAELATRLFSKNPKFFDHVQLISLFVGGLSGLVHYLQTLGIEMPKLFAVLDNATVMITSVIAIILAQLPNDSTK